MLQLIRMNLYRILRDRVLPIILLAFVLLVAIVNVIDFLAPSVHYIGDGPGLQAFMANYASGNVILIEKHFYELIGGSSTLILTLIYCMFFFSGDQRDRMYETVCTVYKNRRTVFFANYLTLCIMAFGFLIYKLLIYTSLFYLAGCPVIFDAPYAIFLKFITYILSSALYISFYYMLYIVFRSSYVPIVLLFAPLLIISGSRFMSSFPLGNLIYLGAGILFLFETSGIDTTDWHHFAIASAVLIPLTAVFLTVSSIVVSKRDLR